MTSVAVLDGELFAEIAWAVPLAAVVLLIAGVAEEFWCPPLFCSSGTELSAADRAPALRAFFLGVFPGLMARSGVFPSLLGGIGCPMFFDDKVMLANVVISQAHFFCRRLRLLLTTSSRSIERQAIRIADAKKSQLLNSGRTSASLNVVVMDLPYSCWMEIINKAEARLWPSRGESLRRLRGETQCPSKVVEV